MPGGGYREAGEPKSTAKMAFEGCKAALILEPKPGRGELFQALGDGRYVDHAPGPAEDMSLRIAHRALQILTHARRRAFDAADDRQDLPKVHFGWTKAQALCCACLFQLRSFGS